MNEDFEIYRVLEGEIPAEDKARLDGYLEGKAEAAVLSARKEELKKRFQEIFNK